MLLATVRHSVLVTLQGTGSAGLEAARAGAPHDPEILRPATLSRQVPQIDRATGLVASAAVMLRAEIADVARERVGIAVGTRTGNHIVARRYADRVRACGQSPAAFSTAGYNVCAGLAAMAAQINGPSIVAAGARSHWADVAILAAGYIARGDADVMLAGQCAVSDDGEWGVCALVALERHRPGGVALAAEANEATDEPAAEIDASPPGTAELPVELGWLEHAVQLHFALCPRDDAPSAATATMRLTGTLGQTVGLRAGGAPA